MDDQHAIRRQIRDAESDIEYSTRRIDEIGQDIERLVPTIGEAFTAGRRNHHRLDRRFELEYCGERFGKDGYHYNTVLTRPGADYEALPA